MVIAIIAIVITGIGVFVAYKALQHSKHVSIEEQRPRLQLNPSFVKGRTLLYKQEGKKVIFTVNINLKNIGKTPAANVTILKDSLKLITPWFEYDGKDSKEPMVSVSLSPQQDFNLMRDIFATINKPNKDEGFTIEGIKTAWEEKRVYVIADISLKYTDASSENEYNVSASYKLYKNSYRLLGSKDE